MDVDCAVCELDSELLSNKNLNVFGLQTEDAIKICRPAGVRRWNGSGPRTTGL